MTTDGISPLSVLYTAATGNSVQFSYRMTKGLWIAVIKMCYGNPHYVDLFANGGVVFTETTSSDEWKEGM